MNLDNLRRFVTTLELGSVTAAAKMLNLPKSSLSRHLTQLEQELNLKLLDRHPRNLKATEAGQQLFDEVSPLIQGLNDAELNIENLRAKPRGFLSIQAPAEFMSEEMAQLSVEFLHEYPDIQLCFTQYTGALPNNPQQTDICFVLHDAPLPDIDSVAKALISFPQSVYCSPHCDQLPNTATLDALEGSKMILQADEKFWQFRTGNNQRLSVPLNVGVTMNSQNMRLHACVRGLGLTRLPDYAAETMLRKGSLKKIKLNHPMVALTLSVLYRHRQVPKKVQVFVEFIQSNIGRLQSRL